MPAKKATKKKGTRKTASKKAKKKPAAGKAAPRKAASRKSAPRKAASRKTAPRKAASRKAAPRKATSRKAPAKKKTRKKAPAKGGQRRAHERHEIPGVLEVQVELMGYMREGREFGIGPAPDPSLKFETRGVTRNLSRGGMLAVVEDTISDGSHCLVRFMGVHGCIQPELRWGLVIRAVAKESGCEVAVSFDVPLEVLDIDGLAA